jgi:hypothetical protein
MKKTIAALIALFLLTGCITQPAVIETYKDPAFSRKSAGKTGISVARILIDTDSPDTEQTGLMILDKLRIQLQKKQTAMSVQPSVFSSDFDQKNMDVTQYLNNGSDYTLFLIFRSRNVGYSVATLNDEKSLTVSGYLYSKEGKMVSSILYSRVVPYSIQNTRYFFDDLNRIITPLFSNI